LDNRTKRIDLGAFVTNDFGDRYIYEVNRSAFNKVGSDSVHGRLFGKRLFQEDSLNIVIGTDSGLLPNYLLKHGIPEGSRFLFVELNEVIDLIGQSHLLKWKREGIEVTTYDSWKEAADRLDLTSYISINGVVLEQSVGTRDANIMEYRNLYWAVCQELTRLAWETSASLGTQAFVVRQLENLAENRIPSSCLKDAFKGKTSVLLGGGPSLDEIIPWLKSNRDRVVILAVSRICRRLLECGLTPHMVFSVDPQLISFDISKELFHFWRNTLFVHAYHVSAPLLAQWRGKGVYSGPRFPWRTPLNMETLPEVGPTVTNAALASAIAMGFSQVMLAGVDLCHSKEGFTHARGSDEHAVGPQLGKMGIMVETNGGWMAETSPDYACAIGIIDLQAKQATGKGCRVINTADGAAKIPNISYARPDEVAIKTLQEPPEKTIARRLPADGRTERIAYYRSILDELARAKGRLIKIRKSALEALKCTDHLLRRGKSARGVGRYRRMNKIEKTLSREYKDFVPLVKQFGIRDFLRIVRPGEANGYIEETDRVRRLKIYYASYRDSASRLTELLEKAEQRLHACLEEEENSPNISLLIEQWEEDGQPGRYLVWKDRNPGAAEKASVTHAEALQGLEDVFRATMKKRETGHMRLTRANISLCGIRNKALTLFERRELAELERLGNGLAASDDPKAKPLMLLTSGYLAELLEDRESALEAYHRLISDHADDAALEDALRRIAFICIDKRDMDNAVAALQCLSQLSPAYSPQYADALRLTGNRDAAAAVYSDYLQKVPDDLGTMLKLGTLYKDLHADEAARMAFNYVLERDPSNGAAKAMLKNESPSQLEY
jgi:tetratricopeptide (TPR) repeat protein